MKPKKFQIQVSDITVEVTKKDIKNVYLRVYPPHGKVCLSSPRSVSPEYLRQFIHSKQKWIRKKIQKVKSQQRAPELQYGQGESHYIQGRQYLLNIIEVSKPPKVIIRNDQYLDLYIRPGSDGVKKEKVLREWYRDLLKDQIPELIKKWERELGVSVREWGVKKMKTRWGTCNTGARRIWLNLELAKKPQHLLEYVVLHEIVHLKERLHNDRFRSFLTRHMPDWREREKELNERNLNC